ncbi:guanine nucleotide-binding protein G(o) subunit alpha [Chytriomyces sp. MP71]|nr:guanine nucleotide-binding protein G(o) subunit alpha [Chytriomyces sp. MP71]
MGCSSSTLSYDDAAAEAVNKDIDRKLQEEEVKSGDLVKLLLLGAAETGKSTVLKQMKLIYGGGFTDLERQMCRNAIISNICSSIKALVDAMEKLQIPYGFDPNQEIPSDLVSFNCLNDCQNNLKDPDFSCELDPARTASLKRPSRPIDDLAKNLYEEVGGLSGQSGPSIDAAIMVKDFDTILGFTNYELVYPKAQEAIITLWNDSGIQYCLSRRNEFQIMDTCNFFLGNVKHFCDEDYIPSDQDILNARMMTTRITETRFTVDKLQFNVFDVAGQRSERKRWAPYFDDVHAIIFLVAISSYDQTCSEDGATNRSKETLTSIQGSSLISVVESKNVFTSICNHPLFKTTPMILFMNKIDLFKQKLKTSPFATYFPEYNGPDEFKPASAFIVSYFLTANKYTERKIYFQFTWATDTNQIRETLNIVREIIINSCLTACNLL